MSGQIGYAAPAARILVKRPDAPPFSVFDKPIPLRALDDVIRQAMLAVPPMRSAAN